MLLGRNHGHIHPIIYHINHHVLHWLYTVKSKSVKVKSVWLQWQPGVLQKHDHHTRLPQQSHRRCDFYNYEFSVQRQFSCKGVGALSDNPHVLINMKHSGARMESLAAMGISQFQVE